MAALPQNVTLTAGTRVFSVTLNAAGSKTITATDGTTPSITGVKTLTVADAESFSWSFSDPGAWAAFVPYDFTLTKIKNGATDTAFTGAVTLTKVFGTGTPDWFDGATNLGTETGIYTFVGGDNGVKTLQVVLDLGGVKIFRAAAGAVTGDGTTADLGA